MFKRGGGGCTIINVDLVLAVELLKGIYATAREKLGFGEFSENPKQFHALIRSIVWFHGISSFFRLSERFLRRFWSKFAQIRLKSSDFEAKYGEMSPKSRQCTGHDRICCSEEDFLGFGLILLHLRRQWEFRAGIQAGTCSDRVLFISGVVT